MADILQRPDSGLILNSENVNLVDKPSEIIQPNDRDDLTGLDEDDLTSYILEMFRNDIEDKRQMGWVDKRNYDVKAYYGLKDKALSNYPWPNSSNFPVPLTPTLLDTAHANIMASIFSGNRGSLKVKDVSVEDMRTSKILQDLLNWQAENEIDIEREYDKTIFRTFLHGTGFLKVYWDIKTRSVKVVSVDIGNMFLPIDAKGLSEEETDHIIQIIPLTYNDLQLRKSMRVYKYPDQIFPGDNIDYGASFEEKLQRMDTASGTSLITKRRRDTYFIAECYSTHYPKTGSSGHNGKNGNVRTGAGVKPLELIVWISPNGGKIQRVRKNDKKIRPFSDHHAYYYPDRYFSMSMPEKIKNIQDEIDYADKQNTDANDRAISPAAFVDDTSTFDGASSQRVPGGIYPKGTRGSTIEWEPAPPVDRGFERRIALLWEQAERLTGIIDITQGRPSAFGGKTLGEVEIRTARADVRFSTIFRRFGLGWKKTWNLIYEYDNEYMDRNKKIRVLGYDNYKSIDELFPTEELQESGLGLSGKYDFSFTNTLVSDQDIENQKIIAFTEAELLSPLVANNPANLWRVEEMRAKAFGINNLETIVMKPSEAKIYSVEEFIQRIISGEKDVGIRPGIDAEGYIFDLEVFMKTETFRSLDDGQKKQIADGLRRAFMISVGEKRALFDLQQIQIGQQAQAMSDKMPLQLPQEQQQPPSTPEALPL